MTQITKVTCDKCGKPIEGDQAWFYQETTKDDFCVECTFFWGTGAANLFETIVGMGGAEVQLMNPDGTTFETYTFEQLKDKYPKAYQDMITKINRIRPEEEVLKTKLVEKTRYVKYRPAQPFGVGEARFYFGGIEPPHMGPGEYWIDHHVVYLILKELGVVR